MRLDDLKWDAHYDGYYYLGWEAALVGLIAVPQWSGLFLSAVAGDLELDGQDGQELLAPEWPDDLNFGEGENTPPRGYLLRWEEEGGI